MSEWSRLEKSAVFLALGHVAFPPPGATGTASVWIGTILAMGLTTYGIILAVRVAITGES